MILSLTALFLVFISGYGFGVKIGASGTPPSYISNTAKDMPGALDFSLFWQTWNKVRELYVGESNPEDMLYGAISGMVAATGDPYTVFLKPSDNEKLSQDLSGQFEGIGAELTMQNQQIVVVTPLSGSPAEKIGIKAKDVIVEIDGNSSAEMSLDEAVNKIRGKAGSEVKLKIFRSSLNDFLELKVTRENIKVDSVTYTTAVVGEKKIAILKLNQFGDDTFELAKKYAGEINNAGVSGIILDLRNNPGGYLDTSIEISNIFLEKGKAVVIEIDKKGEKKEYKTESDPLVKNIPLIVLVNNGSASAAEIITGALRDNKRALTIGEKTFGKGSVQVVEPLANNAAIKVTIAKWLTPNGEEINRKGIAPDIEIKKTAEDEEKGSDPQMDRAKSEILKLIK